MVSNKDTFPLKEYTWDIINRNRLRQYLTAKEVGCIKGFLRKTNVKTVLDIGCGSERIGRALYEDRYQVTAIDYDELPLLWLRSENKNISILRGDAQKASFKDKSFDCVVAIQVISYIDHLDLFYDEMHRILKQGGIFIMNFGNKDSIKGLIYPLYRKLFTGSKGRMYIYTYKQYINKLVNKGFTLIESFGYSWNLLGYSSNSKSIVYYAYIERLLHLNVLVSISPQVIIIMKKV